MTTDKTAIDLQNPENWLPDLQEKLLMLAQLCHDTEQAKAAAEAMIEKPGELFNQVFPNGATNKRVGKYESVHPVTIRKALESNDFELMQDVLTGLLWFYALETERDRRLSQMASDLHTELWLAREENQRLKIESARITVMARALELALQMRSELGSSEVIAAGVKIARDLVTPLYPDPPTEPEETPAAA